MSRSALPRRKFVASLGVLFGSTYLASCGGGGGGDASAAPTPPAPSPNPSAPNPPAPNPPTPSPPAPPANLPAWVPNPGQIANVGLNSLSSTNPCTAAACWYSGSGKQEAPWRNWSGAVFAREYSTHGAMIYWGGGHGGGDDHSLYLFDFATRQWSRIGPTLPPSSYITALDSDWSDFLYEGSYIVPGLHSYNYPSYIPPGKAGVGPKGAWLLPALVSGKGGNAPHAVDLETGQWTRFATAKAGGFTAPYSGSIEDTKRGRIWWGGVGAGDYRWLDYNESTPRSVKVANGRWFGGWYDRFVYVEQADMTVGFWCEFGQTQLKTTVLNMSSGGPSPVGSNAVPAKTMLRAGFGVDWCPITQRFYLYEGNARNTVSVLTPSSLDFSSCTWSWSEETFTGAAPAWFAASTGGGGDVPLSRWRYVPNLRSFAWSDGPRYSAPTSEDGAVRDGVMQLWRPLGT